MWGTRVKEEVWGGARREVHVCPGSCETGQASRSPGGLGPELGLARRPDKTHMGWKEGGAQCPQLWRSLLACPQWGTTL